MWTMSLVSSTSPMISPSCTLSPGFTEGLKFHFFSWSRDVTSIPLAILLPVLFFITSSGLCIPSKIISMIPGPSSADRGSPVETTLSPVFRPAVSSYTCIDALSPRISIISPIKPSSPTCTTSNILALFIFSATTSGPEIFIICP